MKMRSGLLIVFLAILGSCGSRSKEEIAPDQDQLLPATPKKLTIEIRNVFNKEVLLFNKEYRNLYGDTLKITSLAYYISNIALKNKKGDVYAEPESYHLIDLAKGSNAYIYLKNVPHGEYNQLSFSIGVDSTRNHSGAQTGALDPVNNMIWSWSIGYRFVSMGGKFKNSSGSYRIMNYHIAEDVNYKTIVLDSTLSKWSTIDMREGKESIASVQFDFAEMFKTPTTIRIDTLFSVEGGPAMKIIADNYADMCELLEIQNKP